MAWAMPIAQLRLAGCAAQRGEVDVASRLLDQAIAGFERCEMGLLPRCAQHRRAQLAGGDARVKAWMVERGIRRPERIAAMLAPGFPAGPPTA